MSPLDRVLHVLQEQAQVQPPTVESIRMVKKTAKVIRGLCSSELDRLHFFLGQKNMLQSIGWLFQWNSGTEARLRLPKLETVLVEAVHDIFEEHK